MKIRLYFEPFRLEIFFPFSFDIVYCVIREQSGTFRGLLYWFARVGNCNMSGRVCFHERQRGKQCTLMLQLPTRANQYNNHEKVPLCSQITHYIFHIANKKNVIAMPELNTTYWIFWQQQNFTFLTCFIKNSNTNT